MRVEHFRKIGAHRSMRHTNAHERIPRRFHSRRIDGSHTSMREISSSTSSMSFAQSMITTSTSVIRFNHATRDCEMLASQTQTMKSTATYTNVNRTKKR